MREGVEEDVSALHSSTERLHLIARGAVQQGAVNRGVEGARPAADASVVAVEIEGRDPRLQEVGVGCAISAPFLGQLHRARDERVEVAVDDVVGEGLACAFNTL